MIPEQERIEQLTKMAERLSQALQQDIEALQLGRPKTLRMIDDDMQRLSVVYSREVKTLDPSRAKVVPLEIRKRFCAVTERLKGLLDLHQRMVKRVRNASEGIIKAVANDVEKRRNAMRPYVSPKSAYRPPAGAIVYNALV